MADLRESIDIKTTALLDKYHKVENHIDNPKFLPYNYTDEFGDTEKVSPLTDFMYYNKLPEVYRSFDKPLGKPLYRFLQTIFEGGYAPLVNKNVVNKFRRESEPPLPELSDEELTNLGGIENLLELVDPQKCPNKFLPYFCSSLGIQWFPDLANTERGIKNNDYYNRTFLSNIGEIYKRRGTESCIKYIAKVLTEMDVKLKYERVFNPDKTTKSRIMWVELQAETPEDIENVGINAKVIKRYIDTQIPYYITTAILYLLKQKAKAGLYSGSFVKSNITKTIMCKDEYIKTSVNISTVVRKGNIVVSNITKEISTTQQIGYVFKTSQNEDVVPEGSNSFSVIEE